VGFASSDRDATAPTYSRRSGGSARGGGGCLMMLFLFRRRVRRARCQLGRDGGAVCRQVSSSWSATCPRRRRGRNERHHGSHHRREDSLRHGAR